MNDYLILQRPQRRSFLGQHIPKISTTDDFFKHLSPSHAIDALNAATGELKHHLASAPATERDFVTRTAQASQKIWEWEKELCSWKWPLDGGSAGFQNPNGDFKISSPLAGAVGADSGEYKGCLPAREVAIYRQRIDAISRDLDDLDVEEIKACVLTDHVLPLSGPSTPSSSPGGNTWAAPTCPRMADTSVIATTLVIQTLPTLAALSRLLKIWEIRLNVLQLIPGLLCALGNAESGLEAAWNAVSDTSEQSTEMNEKGVKLRTSSLKRADVDLLRSALGKKVAIPGKILDDMLDNLEGSEDTVPESWLDRMESIELRYGEWAAACERQVRKHQWARSSAGHDSLIWPASRAGNVAPQDQSGSADLSHMPPNVSRLDNLSDRVSSGQTSSDMELDLEPSSIADELLDNTTNSGKGLDAVSVSNSISTISQTGEADDLDLPPLRGRDRQDSTDSFASRLPDEDSSRFDVSPGGLPEMSRSVRLPHTRTREVQFIGTSPPSSPALSLEDNGRDSLGGYLQSPSRTSILQNDITTRDEVPTETSFVEYADDEVSISEWSDFMSRRNSVDDGHVQQRISQIIESLSANIKLSAQPSTEPTLEPSIEPSSINLNPPGLQLPREMTMNPFKGAKSNPPGWSSRATTPSFTLSPVRNIRSRQAKGRHNIKVYHLSRSTGEAPIKLFIRCVGEHGERVMVRVGGGWADLSEYLKQYATYHRHRSVGADQAPRVEIQDAQQSVNTLGSSPFTCPGAATARATESSPQTSLHVRRSRRSLGPSILETPRVRSKSPAEAETGSADAPLLRESKHSSPNSRLGRYEDDSSPLGLGGPMGKRVEMSEENKAWVESVKEKVRIVSGEKRLAQSDERARLGDLGAVGATRRVFRKSTDASSALKRH